jgi:hypothetical protein
MANEIGTCALCQTYNAELRESHIMPKWAYKRLRGNPSGGNPNPVVITNGVAAQVSNQVTEHLLCAECEQRLSVAEKYVSELSYRTDGTPTPLNTLGVAPGASSTDGMALASGKQLDFEKLTYFAVSVVWRAGVAKRSDTGKPKLGPYADTMRRYLLGETPLPKSLSAQLFVADVDAGGSRPFHNFATFPASKKEDGYYRHEFFVCGLLFQVAIGNQLPVGRLRMCLHHGSDKPIMILPPTDIGLSRTVGAQAQTAERKGKLK